MFFFFRKPTVVLDCFLQESNEYIAKLSPIESANYFYPEWWKSMPSFFEEQNKFWPVNSIKQCSGILDYYTKSIALPLWSDLAISVDQFGNFRWQFSDEKTQAEFIDEQQWNKWLSPEKYFNLRIISPWAIRTKNDVNFLVGQPYYNLNNLNDYHVSQGILSFKYQTSTNPILFVDKEKPRDFLIPRNQVLYFLTPLTEKKVKVKRHIVGDSEFAKIRSVDTRTKFIGKHRDNMKQENRFKKCPFHINR